MTARNHSGQNLSVGEGLRPSPTKTQFIWIIVISVLLSACNLNVAPTAQPVQQTATSQQIVAAWVEAGNLVVWRQGDELPRRIASGGVVRPYVSPDGENIAFTRGPNSIPSTLWVVDVGGTAERQLVGEGEPRIFTGDESQLGQIRWFDEAVLYFTTLAKDTPAYTPRNDLYRTNIRTREVSRILPPGEGGQFTFSPDGELIAVVSSGTYGRQDALISVIDPLALDGARNLLFYVGVATGSHAAFYPTLHWLPDNSALLVAIPDSDLIYSDTEDAESLPPTRLWRLPIENPSDRELIGSVQSSFFGLPQWSDDGTQMTYIQRESGSNEFIVYTADADGGNPVEYVRGQAGEIERPTWLPDSNRFIYTLGDLGSVFLGIPGQDPLPLSAEVVITPRFVSADGFVFITPAAVAADGLHMRFAEIGSPSERISNVGATIPIYDAALIDS